LFITRRVTTTTPLRISKKLSTCIGVACSLSTSQDKLKCAPTHSKLIQSPVQYDDPLGIRSAAAHAAGECRAAGLLSSALPTPNAPGPGAIPRKIGRPKILVRINRNVHLVSRSFSCRRQNKEEPVSRSTANVVERGRQIGITCPSGKKAGADSSGDRSNFLSRPPTAKRPTTTRCEKD